MNPWANPWAGTFELVNPREIVVDHQYQRPPKPVLINLISANVNWEAFGCVICFKRKNGMFYAIDGQQRLAGVLASDKPPMAVPVLWYASQGPEHEAKVFDIINTSRKALSGHEKYKARLCARDEVYLQIQSAVDRAGFTVGHAGREAVGGRTVGAISALNFVYNLAGEEGVFRTLIAIKDAWDGDGKATDAFVLKTIGTVIAESTNGNLNRRQLAAGLGRTTPEKLVRLAESLRFELGGSKLVNMRRAFKKLTKL